MANITAQMVKELREKTGAGMMDCKKALVAVAGDPEKAVDWLRQKGMAKAATKSNRATAEGLVCIIKNTDQTAYAMSSLYCETDFVARGDKFKDQVQKIAQIVLDKNPTTEELVNLVGDEVKQLIATVGENMKIGDFFRHEKSSANEVVGEYIHSNGKIAVLVWAETGKSENVDNVDIKNLLHELAMQVTATNPMALDGQGVDPEAIERERKVYIEKAKADGKPDQIVAKIAEGAVQKFKKSVCLLDQPYIKEEKKAVKDVINECAKKIGDSIKVLGYKRLQLSVDN
ncbi:MAG: translation elongation factor Ts [Desulfovibrio sp.]|nr:translation elongation factor Ts [Desulfovibrio sp.]